MEENPYQSPLATDRPAGPIARSWPRITFVEVLVIVPVLGVLGDLLIVVLC
jgi:hypothetical protein